MKVSNTNILKPEFKQESFKIDKTKDNNELSRVDKIKEEIQNNTYKINLDTLANKIAEDLIS